MLNKLQNGAKSIIENINNNKKYRSAIWAVVILFCFGFILLLNILTPMMTDDYSYKFIFGSMNPVASLGDIIESQTRHYFEWGGRTVVHVITQLLLMLPPIAIDVLNSLAYTVFILLIYLLIKGRNKNSISLFLLIFISVWFLQPSFGDTILWTTGSANYLWGTILILLFLLPYRFHNTNKKSKGYLSSILFFIYGIIAGWTNENSAAAMILIAMFFVYTYYRKQLSIPKWAINGILGAIIGYLCMILAPGNMARANTAMSFDLYVFLYRFVQHTLSLINYCGILIILYLILTALIFSVKTKDILNRTITPSFIFMVGFLAAVYSMILSPTFPPRAWFGAITFIIIAIGIVYHELCLSVYGFRGLKYWFVTLMGIAFLFSAYPALKDINNCYQLMCERYETINNADEKSTITFKRFHPNTKFTHYEDEKAIYLLINFYGKEMKFEEEN